MLTNVYRNTLNGETLAKMVVYGGLDFVMMRDVGGNWRTEPRNEGARVLKVWRARGFTKIVKE